MPPIGMKHPFAEQHDDRNTKKIRHDVPGQLSNKNSRFCEQEQPKGDQPSSAFAPPGSNELPGNALYKAIIVVIATA